MQRTTFLCLYLVLNRKLMLSHKVTGAIVSHEFRLNRKIDIGEGLNEPGDSTNRPNKIAAWITVY